MSRPSDASWKLSHLIRNNLWFSKYKEKWRYGYMYWKYHNFERNKIRATGFLKWMDFSCCLISDQLFTCFYSLGKNPPKSKKESLSISKAAQIKKKTQKSMIHFATTKKNKILLSSQRSNKKRINKTNDSQV